MTRLTCSECGCAAYVINHTLAPGDIICDVCEHAVGWSDIYSHLDDGEKIVLDDDGYICVTAPVLESEHAYGYYSEN